LIVRPVFAGGHEIGEIPDVLEEPIVMKKTVYFGAGLCSATLCFSAAANAQQVLPAANVSQAIVIDGNTEDWNSVRGITVPLAGRGGVGSVEMKAAVRDGRIYVLAVWADSSENILHKPFKWNEASGSYKKDAAKEDRLAISFKMSGDFSMNKIGGNEFEADVWHWKASRSNPAGIVHDKMWKISKKPFEKAKEWPTPDGNVVYLARPSDAGDRLYKPLKYTEKQGEVMPRYEVNLSPSGSLADVEAKGVWRDGHWHLEMSRKLDTGHDDDAAIPESGTIEMAIAAFNNVDSGKHSVSEVVILQTGGSGL
jgi:hypothetical protein